MTLFRLFGFEVKVDLSWLVLAMLITWSLSASFFPTRFHDLPESMYWWMGLAGTAGLFFSIVFHEMSHSLMARRYGLRIRGITLFIFGGVAEMEEEPASPKTELRMALAGPLASVVLWLLFWLNAHAPFWPVPVRIVTDYLAAANLALAVFNLFPAFPLDGGRVLRALLWGWKKNLGRATRVAANMGAAFGWLLMIAGGTFVFFGTSGLVLHGPVSMFGNAIVSGLWLFLIGMFLRNAARMSYRRLVMRHALQGERIERFMRSDPLSVAPSLSVAALVDDYIYRYHFKMFPVVDQGALVGCITVRRVRRIPREQWNGLTVGDVLEKCSTENTISAYTDPVHALALMNRTGNSRLMVVDVEQRLVGVVTLKDMLKFLSLKLDLEGIPG